MQQSVQPNLAETSDSELVAQLLETLTLVPYEEGVFIGQSHDYVGARIFGGQVLAQALMAASHTVDSARACHSLHGYFLRGGDIKKPVFYRVERLRDGHSLSARQVTATQMDNANQPKVIFTMLASFAPYEQGLEYLYIRFLLGSSFLRIIKIKNKKLKSTLLFSTWKLLNETFPNWKKNQILKNSYTKKDLYYKTINKFTYKFYSKI